MAFSYWEVTTPAGITVERDDSDGPFIVEGVLYFKVDDLTQAFFSMRNVIGVGRITEEEYETFKAQAETPEEDLDMEDNDRYRSLLQGHIEN